LRQTKYRALNHTAGAYNYDDWELRMVEPANLKHYAQTLRAVKQFQDERHLPGFFLTLPHAPREHLEPRYRPVEPVFRAAGLEWHNLLPELVRQFGTIRTSSFHATPTDYHPGPMLSHFFAVQAADILEQRYPQMLGAKSAPRPALPRVNDWVPAQLDEEQTAPNVFAFDYPLHDWELPFMPVQKTYVQLNLERPVALQRIRVEGKHLLSCEGWYTSIGKDDYDDDTPHILPAGRCEWDLTARPDAKAIATIRIHAEIGQGEDVPVIVGRQRIRLQAPYAPFGGFGWVYKLPAELALVGSTNDHPKRSTLRLTENGTSLVGGNDMHDSIRSVGAGRFSHWTDYLFFTASDNSDPNSNGRVYDVDVEKIVSHPRRLVVTMTPAPAEAAQP
ncbi:MAG: hypothetical protein JWO56_2459, partial [Acidobacteria bacterium]|nr:hypothetical protein [Acidobacteriota bacterium]